MECRQVNGTKSTCLEGKKGTQASKTGEEYLPGGQKRNPGKQKSIGVKKSTKFFIRDTMVS